MSADEYEIKGKDAEGKGVFREQGFLVKAGYLARGELVDLWQQAMAQTSSWAK
jgi:hypothetical protein